MKKTLFSLAIFGIMAIGMPAKAQNKLTVNADQGKETISKHINVSASKDASGKIHITLVNIDANKSQNIEIELRGATAKKVSGKVLTSAKVNDHNTLKQ